MLDAESPTRFATLLADRSRASICLALMDGRAWTAGELATHAGIAASTASEHLSMLVHAGLLTEERQGRHRYLRLTDPATEQLLEDLAAAVDRSRPPTSLRAVRAGRRPLLRTCLDWTERRPHLAGTLGAAVHRQFLARAWIAPGRRGRAVALTPEGRAAPQHQLGLDLPDLRAGIA